MSTATLVAHLDDWDTDAALYRLDPPVLAQGSLLEHVVVSTKHEDGDHGSVVLASDAAGAVTSWAPIASTGSVSHADALALLGYEVQS